MQILTLQLFECRPLNNVYNRPYKTIVDNESLNALDAATHGGKTINFNNISSVAGRIIQPSAEVESVAAIAGGWGISRYRFVLEALESDFAGSQVITYYIGHTDRADDAVSAGGYIDNTLCFHVNSKQTIQIGQRRGADMTVLPHLKTTAAEQFLFKSTPNTVGNAILNGLDNFKIRPSDLFLAKDVQVKLASYADVPVVDSTSTLLSGGALSARRNNTASSYLYDTLKAYDTAVSTEYSYGGDETNIYREAAGYCKDGNIFVDNLMSFMENSVRAIRTNGVFTWHDLKMVCPYIDDVTTVGKLGDYANMRNRYAQQTGVSEFSNVWDNTNTANWNGSDAVTIAATILANSVPTIMLENLCVDLRCHITNHTIDGSYAFTLYNVRAIREGINTSALYERIINRIEFELLPTITNYGIFSIDILIDSSVYGDTMINIGLNGEPPIPYVMPTFADNVASPIITQSSKHYNRIAHDMLYVSEHLINNRNIQPIVTSPNPQDVYTTVNDPQLTMLDKVQVTY